MERDNNLPDVPPAAPGPWKNAAWYGTVGAAVGAVFGAAFGRSHMTRNQRMVSGAIDTGIFAGVLGYFMGERNVTEHKLQVENAQLKAQLPQSFVVRLQEEPEHACNCHSKG